MVADTIIVEAVSVEEAREKAKAQISADRCVLSEKIIDDGRVKTRTVAAGTTVVPQKWGSKADVDGLRIIENTSKASLEYTYGDFELLDSSEEGGPPPAPPAIRRGSLAEQGRHLVG